MMTSVARNGTGYNLPSKRGSRPYTRAAESGMAVGDSLSFLFSWGDSMLSAEEIRGIRMQLIIPMLEEDPQLAVRLKAYLR